MRRDVALPIGLVIVMLCGGAVAARGEVWPTSGDALARGPWALVDRAPLAAWSNPAAWRDSARLQAGVARVQPFGLAEWSRLDAAAGLRIGRVVVGAGGAWFGSGALGTSAVALGGALPIAASRLHAGLWVRRHARAEQRALAADLGLLAQPLARLHVAAVTRSVVTSGEPAPDPEWEVAAAWDEGSGGVALSLARDAAGPLAATIGTRLALGPAHAHASLSRIAGGETRAALALIARLPGGAAVVAAREVGVRLPESSAWALWWASPPRPRPSASAPPTPPRDGGEAPDSSGGDDDESELDRLQRSLDSRADNPEDELLGFSQRSLGGSGSGEQRRASPAANLTPTRLRKHGEIRAGVVAGAERALALMAFGGASVRLDQRTHFLAALAASRDGGEPRAIDEVRASIGLARAHTLTAILGDFDAHLGDGAIVRAPAPGARALRLAPAARVDRAPLAPARGAAILWSGPFHGRALALAAETRRDARVLGGGMTPVGGRFHRTDLEMARRAALREQIGAIAFEWPAAARLRITATGATARYEPSRRFPGGAVLDRGTWLSFRAASSSRASRLSATWTQGPSRQHAFAFDVDRHLRSGPLAAATLAVGGRSSGFAPATTWPGSVPKGRIESTLRLRAPALRLRALAERWTTTSIAWERDRHGARWETEIGADARRGAFLLTGECGTSETWREEEEGASRLSATSAAAWLAARATWRLASGSAVLGTRVQRQRDAWQEGWQMAYRRAELAVAIAFRPGTAVATSALVADPLAGATYERAGVPARLTVEWRRPRDLGIRLLVSSRSTGDAPRIALWCWAGGGDSIAPPGAD